MSDQDHPLAPHHLPGFITAPGETDILMVAVGIFLIGAVLFVGNIYLQIHSLPERMAHKSQKLQFEIVAVLGLLALFTHIHIFWVAALLLAMIDLPDFSTPLRSIAVSVAKMAGVPLGADSNAMPNDLSQGTAQDKVKDTHGKDNAGKGKDAPAKETLSKDTVGKESAGKSEVKGHA
jgi:hypothetical protein